MTLLEFLNRIKLTVRGPKFKKASVQALKKNEAAIMQTLRANSPVDSGFFRSRWRVSLTKFAGADELAGMIISNDTSHYGQFIEHGAEPGQAPWYFPKRSKAGKTKGQMVKGTGKLKLSDGKVWAGGLQPGHNLTVGGVLQNVFSDKSKILEKLMIDVSNSAIRVFI